MSKPTRLSHTNTPTEEGKSISKPNHDYGMQFDVEEHKRHIEKFGIKTLWEKSFICPCKTSMTASPDPLCTICHGRGVGYLVGKETTVAYQNQGRGVLNTFLGISNTGTAMATTLPNSRITFWDRLSLPDVKVEHSLMFNVTRHRLRNGIHLSYNVDRITLAVTDSGTPLKEGPDYDFDEETNMLYPKEHLHEKNISLNVICVLRYVVMDIEKEARMQYTNKGKFNEELDYLSKRLLLKREDALVDSINLRAEGEDDSSFSHEYNDTEQGAQGGFFGGALNG